MKKLLTTILTTSAATVGLLMAGTLSANADATYTVKKGDCVWAISQEYKTTIESIETANNIHGHLILPGQQLRIPGATAPVTATQTPAAPVTTAPVQTAPVQQAPATTPAQPAETPAVTAPATPVETAPAQTSEPAATTPAPETYTGGNLQSYVLGQMQSRTGVSASTWDHIINRESNWQPHVVNGASGAYGLFQNIHISGGSVQQQIDAAVNLYHAQGMQAWALY
ncbi:MULTISPECIES: LysM peptidoglycan-binding domain-containing protein [Lactiplantibacillus]|uniref:LysM peptidoglycan-binding domain-containing protein n=1 Tax=Lactiplantibacillus pentosus TaxID=1589 RepID=A0ABD7IQ38_LACPE|nr:MULTISPECIES: LysM peptidoglycan-binding domain-containing protein [Lactiplantibacillus]AYG38330.1 LysM peptidoglycan-binding domain-containing protein [Lactiplantibacillus pentosus]AYG40988.1 LysM peptidoglycan-binding domain-containing protein [Lactiplantibacillus pentosus]MCC3163941.1 LysM peptidoglycan-binding domain-containing protein [Lactiplantibacillus pentosus]MCJ8181853.1 LysM peptidoglycan-binding domain-containing protein [Lactiplantibacillus pentosus]MCJ8188874.1 LysM peptidogl